MLRLALFETPILVAGTFARAMGRGMDYAAATMGTMRQRAEVRTLLALDEHMLSDIGLVRSDLHDALKVPAGADPTASLSLAAARRRAALWSAELRLRRHPAQAVRPRPLPSPGQAA